MTDKEKLEKLRNWIEKHCTEFIADLSLLSEIRSIEMTQGYGQLNRFDNRNILMIRTQNKLGQYDDKSAINECLDLSCCHHLEEVFLPASRLTSIKFPQNNKIMSINLNYNELTELDTSECPQLDRLYFASNPIKRLDLSNNKLLRLINSGGIISHLDKKEKENIRQHARLGIQYIVSEETNLNDILF